MKPNSVAALVTTAQALSITSQLLAIGIEVGIIAGGFVLYRKLKDELTKPEPQPIQAVQFVEPEKQTIRQKWSKTKKILKAVIS